MPVKDVNLMTIDEINKEVKQARDAAFCGRSHSANKKPRRKALEARFQALMDAEVNGIAVINPEAFEEKQG